MSEEDGGWDVEWMGSDLANDHEKRDDAAKYLLEEKQFHDCSLLVGKDSEEELFGVMRGSLMAHSSVFRRMLDYNENSLFQVKEPIRITDVSPQIFKLVLRHVYGCLESPEDVPVEDALELVFCADKYNIPALVRKASQLLVPSSVVQVFPALKCVVYVNSSMPLLGAQVIHVVQLMTMSVLSHSQFLELDENCVEFVMQQPNLRAKELDLFKSLVRWGQHQLSAPGAHRKKSLREVVDKPLRHIRLTNLSKMELVDVVFAAGVLTDAEFVAVLRAVTQNTPLSVPGLCEKNHRRAQHHTQSSNIGKRYNNLHTFDPFVEFLTS